MQSFRWINLLPMREGRFWDRCDKDKVIQIEFREQPVKTDIFYCPKMGDLLHDFLQDVFKCQYWAKQLDSKYNIEKEGLMNSYFEFVIENRRILDLGTYKTITTRPSVTFKEPLTQEIVALNAPDLSKDEDLRQGVNEIA